VSTITAEDLVAGAAATHRIRIPDPLAPPALSGDDGAEVVIRPLVLADVVRLGRASREDGDLCSALMVQQALVDPPMSIDQVHRLPAGLAEFLLSEVNRISGLSMARDDVDALIREPLTRACVYLAREYGWTPDRCAELTVGQVLVYLQAAGGAEPGP
jgi:hypothetical protein